MTDSNANSLEKPSDLGTSPEAVARRWKLELKLADKREKSWRKKATDIYKLYTPEDPARHSFNILWTNTETLRQSVYNSLPEPDARRRYQDEDPLGKQVGEVLTRALEFCQDTYDFDAVLKGDVLAMLLAGRAVSRVRYVPDFRAIEGGDPKEEGEAPDEEIAWEAATAERVHYQDFRILGAAKTWEQVPAIAYGHRFTREDCIEKFGEEVGNAIKLDSADDEDVKNSKDCEDLFKTAQVWEIWNKDDKEVIWICETYPTPCKTQDDPLGLSVFFPSPRPLYAIENDQTLVPAALYTQYEQQAKELNKISGRINKLVEGLKSRGIYDSTFGELGTLMKAGDNDLVPAQDVARWIEAGGLEKAIWMMPIDGIANVIKELYIQRDACKQIIYEITGIADIMRGATDARETMGAQEIKTQWGTQRLQRMQREVQRYIRDLIRLKAEIIAEKFQPETLEKMTLVQLPHQAELDAKKAQLIAQHQQATQQAAMSGQPPPPPPAELQQPLPISWEVVIEAMRSDATRTYRIDIETDSTLSATQDSDMQGMRELLTGITAMIAGFGPAVQSGAMSIDVVKEIMLTVCRRAKMGSSVEDAISKMTQPKPPPDPEKAKAEATMMIKQGEAAVAKEIETFKAQLADQQHQRELAANAQAAEFSARLDAQVEESKQRSQAQQNEHQNMLEASRAEQQAIFDAVLAERELASNEKIEALRAELAIVLKRMDGEQKQAAAETTAAAKQSEAANANV